MNLQSAVVIPLPSTPAPIHADTFAAGRTLLQSVQQFVKSQHKRFFTHDLAIQLLYDGQRPDGISNQQLSCRWCVGKTPRTKGMSSERMVNIARRAAHLYGWYDEAAATLIERVTGTSALAADLRDLAARKERYDAKHPAPANLPTGLASDVAQLLAVAQKVTRKLAAHPAPHRPLPRPIKDRWELRKTCDAFVRSVEQLYCAAFAPRRFADIPANAYRLSLHLLHDGTHPAGMTNRKLALQWSRYRPGGSGKMTAERLWEVSRRAAMVYGWYDEEIAQQIERSVEMPGFAVELKATAKERRARKEAELSAEWYRITSELVRRYGWTEDDLRERLRKSTVPALRKASAR